MPAQAEDVRAIARLYSAAFDREPKVDGLNFWVNNYESGNSLVTIANNFYGSPEFTNKYGPLNNRQYVEQLYRNVLGRKGAESGISFWLAKLSSGTTRALVLAKFADSPENIQKTLETFANMRLSGSKWVFDESVGNVLQVAGDYIIDTSALRYSCSNGETGTGATFHNNFQVFQTDTEIHIEPKSDILIPGITISSSTDLTGSILPDSSFTVRKSATGYSSTLNSPIAMDYVLRGNFGNREWSGTYEYSAHLSRLGITCNYKAAFSGTQILPGSSQSPGGIWSGSIRSSNGEVFEALGFVTESGEMRFITSDSEQSVGTMTVKNSSFDATLIAYLPVGSYYIDTGLTFAMGNASGILAERSYLFGSAYLNGIVTSEFDFSYDPIYERSSSLSKIAGKYSDKGPGGFVENYTVDGVGRITGSNSDGCRYNGALSLLNTKYNLYRIVVTITSCDVLNGEYSGLASLSDDGGKTNDTLLLTVTGPRYIVSGYLPKL